MWVTGSVIFGGTPLPVVLRCCAAKHLWNRLVGARRQDLVGIAAVVRGRAAFPLPWLRPRGSPTWRSRLASRSRARRAAAMGSTASLGVAQADRGPSAPLPLRVLRCGVHGSAARGSGPPPVLGHGDRHVPGLMGDGRREPGRGSTRSVAVARRGPLGPLPLAVAVPMDLQCRRWAALWPPVVGGGHDPRHRHRHNYDAGRPRSSWRSVGTDPSSRVAGGVAHGVMVSP